MHLFLSVCVYCHLHLLIFTYMDLFSYARIYYQLYILILICQNLLKIFLASYSLCENKQVYKHHHLKQIFYNQNMIIMFCWICMFQFYFFLLWILFILYLVIFLLNKMSLYSLNFIVMLTPFAVLNSLPSSKRAQKTKRKIWAKEKKSANLLEQN